ncbi:hypothetical protein ABZX51_009704 [Aspergillus tubingensis]|uniref:Uncharacterized protein n=1 Tax=Aspergillus tubingensis (strain CBS 134.48) TaxID=767770 RepID=A0A1L9NF28_ASPTC|nr:hypothetical protein ASPTUDRAFT_80989 [Aspergillus tubingensis CBS 134.48]
MKLTSTLAASLLVFANAASAGQCVSGLNYCGSTLVDAGYHDIIQQSLRNAGEITLSNSPGVWWGTYWKCNPGGSITYLGGCVGGCFDAGPGKSDICSHDASNWL